MNSNGNSVSLLLGKGDGTFGAKTDTPWASIREVIAGDFDGDACGLAVANLLTEDVSVLLNTTAAVVPGRRRTLLRWLAIVRCRCRGQRGARTGARR